MAHEIAETFAATGSDGNLYRLHIWNRIVDDPTLTNSGVPDKIIVGKYVTLSDGRSVERIDDRNFKIVGSEVRLIRR